jgi:hypothetical protein
MDFIADIIIFRTVSRALSFNYANRQSYFFSAAAIDVFSTNAWCYIPIRGFQKFEGYMSLLSLGWSQKRHKKFCYFRRNKA